LAAGLGFQTHSSEFYNALFVFGGRGAISYLVNSIFVSTHDTIATAFKANKVFQSRMQASGVKSHIRTKIATLKVQLAQGEKVQPEHLA